MDSQINTLRVLFLLTTSLAFTVPATAQVAETLPKSDPAPTSRQGDAEEALAESGEAHEAEDERDEIIVTARSGRRLRDEPIHVEVLGGEEIQESAMMAPSQVAHLLSETSGVRVQVVSPSLGAANISIRGLPGRYTQILADGLPLYGGQTGALAILQIPPSDLGRVEVIKGIASALYGPSALGGVINLVSRRPDEQLGAELTLNATNRKGQDVIGYSSGPLSTKLGLSLFGGFSRQSLNDLDGDGWADLPSYRRAVVRPRFFWEDDAGNSLLVTLGASAEDRRGGTLDGRFLPDGSAFREELKTRRLDIGTAGRLRVGDGRTVSFRASAMQSRERQRFGDELSRETHGTWFGEIALTGEGPRHNWTIGAAIQQDRFRSEQFKALDYTYTYPSLFVQDEYVAADWLTLAASARVDFHNRFGTLFSPRLSALFRPGEWTLRASIGSGYFTPTPLTEETEATGLSRVSPLRGIVAEQAITGSIDIGRRVGPFEINAAIFGSVIKDTVELTGSTIQSGRFEFVNVNQPYRSFGAELLARYHQGPLSVTGGYVFLDATKFDKLTGRRAEVALRPRHAVTFAAFLEDEEWGMLGFEALYTGGQRLEDNPYRTNGKPFLQVGLLIALNISEKLTLFVNGENLTNVRQSRFDPLVLPTRAANGRWTVDAWAPLDGRIVNAGVRMRF